MLKTRIVFLSYTLLLCLDGPEKSATAFRLPTATICHRRADPHVAKFEPPGSYRYRRITTLGIRAKRIQDDYGDNTMDEIDLTLVEQQVLASVQERLDVKRVREALQEGDDFGRLVKSSSPTTITAPQWQIALAAASASSAFAFFVLTSSNFFVAAVVWIVIFGVANGDPLDEDNAAGAMARLLGRTTLKSVQASQPKIKALVRAVVTEQEEIFLLQQQVQELQDENEKLRLWKKRRLQVDRQLSQYSVEQLKAMVRQHRSVSGLSSSDMPIWTTKLQLMMRLLEAGIIADEDPPSSQT